VIERTEVNPEKEEPMATKRARTSGKKVKSLRAKSLSSKKAKGIKGGEEIPKESIRWNSPGAFKIQKV
jgi:hypothetical protein